MRVTLFVVRALERWYPPAFREQYGREVEESTRVLAQLAWARGVWSGVMFTLCAWIDLVRSVLTERGLAKLRGGLPQSGRFEMSGPGQDLRQALRQLRRNPGFAAAVVITLTLAIGGVTAVFAIADPLLFKPLPYRDASRIVVLTADTERAPGELFAADYLQLRRERGAFESITRAGVEYIGVASDDTGVADTVAVAGVSPEFFDVFGVQPSVGRAFRPDEYLGARVAIITYGLWVSAYGQRQDIIGQQLALGGSKPIVFDIVGVMPRGFVFPDFRDQVPVALTPVETHPSAPINAGYYSVPFARLRDGATHEAALETVQRAMTAVENAGPQFRKERRWPVVTPLREALYGSVRRPMLMLLAVTALVLILASANLAHLFMARASGRMRELATRHALGASRGRLVRLLMMEALVLMAAGASGALLLATALKPVALGMLPPTALAVRGAADGFDVRVFLASGFIACGSLLVFGLLPALGAARADLRGSIVSTPHAARRRWRDALVLAQTSTVVAVVVTALMLVASFARLANRDFGFNPSGMHRVDVTSVATARRDFVRVRQHNFAIKERIERLAASPVAMVFGIPGESLPLSAGRLDQERSRYLTVAYPVSSEFFEVFGTSLVRGRLFSAEEAANGAPLAVIDKRAADWMWSGGDPIGQQMRDSSGAVREVIGVISTLTVRVFGERRDRAATFIPLPVEHRRAATFLWRPRGALPSNHELRDAIRQVDPQAYLLVSPVRVIQRQLTQPRFLAILLGALAALAIALTVVGLYGVVSHGVAQRTREMGIRIALGAETARIARLIVMQALKPAALGVALGLASSLWWTETLRSLLYGFTPHDPRIFAGAGLLVMGLVLAACVSPIRRATRVDPLIALKSE